VLLAVLLSVLTAALTKAAGRTATGACRIVWLACNLCASLGHRDDSVPAVILLAKIRMMSASRVHRARRALAEGAGSSPTTSTSIAETRSLFFFEQWADRRHCATHFAVEDAKAFVKLSQGASSNLGDQDISGRASRYGIEQRSPPSVLTHLRRPDA